MVTFKKKPVKSSRFQRSSLINPNASTPFYITPRPRWTQLYDSIVRTYRILGQKYLGKYGGARPSTLIPQPSTLNPRPSTLNPKFLT